MGMDFEEAWFSADIQSRFYTGGDLEVHGSFLQVMTGDDASCQMKEQIGADIRDVAKS